MLSKALSLLLRFSAMPQQTKMELYTELNKYIIDVSLQQIKTESRIIALEYEVKKLAEQNINKSIYKH